MNSTTVRFFLNHFVRGQWQSLYAYDSNKLSPPASVHRLNQGLADSLLVFSPRYLFASLNTATLYKSQPPAVRILILTIRSSFLQAYNAFTLNDNANVSRFISAASVGLLQLIRDLGYLDTLDEVWSDSDLVFLEHTFRSFFSIQLRLSSCHFPKRLTLVLGMHRSGTSALTGMLNFAGLDAPTDPLGATDSNPLGYWESERLVGTTDQYLSRSGFHWSSLFSFSSNWHFTPEGRQWSLSYYDSMSYVFPQSNHALLKDPRLCILSHGFSSWLQSGLVGVDFILIIRQPLEVAFSLQKSEGLSLYQSICLWISSVLESERVSRMMPRLCVTYDYLLDHPASVIQSCIELFQADTHSDDQEVLRTTATSFVRPDFRRQRADSLLNQIPPESSLNTLLPFADSVYRIFESCSLNDLQQQHNTLDRLYAQWRLFITSIALVDNRIIMEH